MTDLYTNRFRRFAIIIIIIIIIIISCDFASAKSPFIEWVRMLEVFSGLRHTQLLFIALRSSNQFACLQKSSGRVGV